MTNQTKKKRIEARVGVPIYRGWVLDGAGQARFGWYAQHACKQSWLGYTLAKVYAQKVLAQNTPTPSPFAP